MEAKIRKIEAWVKASALLHVVSLVLAITKVFLLSTGGESPPASNTNSVQIGEATPSAATSTTSHRDYLTTEEVAALESVSPRTVQTWIAQSRITPAPQRSGRKWQISADYRIQPQTAASSIN